MNLKTPKDPNSHQNNNNVTLKENELTLFSCSSLSLSSLFLTGFLVMYREPSGRLFIWNISSFIRFVTGTAWNDRGRHYSDVWQDSNAGSKIPYGKLNS